MSKRIQLEIDLPVQLARFRFPKALDRRLQELLDKQDEGQPLTTAERREAEGLVELAELISLLRMGIHRRNRRAV